MSQVTLVCAQRSREYAHSAQRRWGLQPLHPLTSTPYWVMIFVLLVPVLYPAYGVVTWVSSLERELPEVRHHLLVIICPVMNAVLVPGAPSRCLPSEFTNE